MLSALPPGVMTGDDRFTLLAGPLVAGLSPAQAVALIRRHAREPERIPLYFRVAGEMRASAPENAAALAREAYRLAGLASDDDADCLFDVACEFDAALAPEEMAQLFVRWLSIPRSDLLERLCRPGFPAALKRFGGTQALRCAARALDEVGALLR